MNLVEYTGVGIEERRDFGDLAGWLADLSADPSLLRLVMARDALIDPSPLLRFRDPIYYLDPSGAESESAWEAPADLPKARPTMKKTLILLGLGTLLGTAGFTQTKQPVENRDSDERADRDKKKQDKKRTAEHKKRERGEHREGRGEHREPPAT